MLPNRAHPTVDPSLFPHQTTTARPGKGKFAQGKQHPQDFVGDIPVELVLPQDAAGLTGPSLPTTPSGAW